MVTVVSALHRFAAVLRERSDPHPAVSGVGWGTCRDRRSWHVS